MLKTHSAGIGDLLRSSAAWRALKNRYPGAELHLLMLTREPGYSSERFIARHHLLKSFRALDKRVKGLAGWRQLLGSAEEYAATFRPDLIIDFEPNGLKTTTVARWLAWRFRARTVGMGAVPLRGLLYGRASVSLTEYFARRPKLSARDYTNRDFVALSALGIERDGTAIELEETDEGRNFRRAFRQRSGLAENARLLSLNIGCGTPHADWRRPSFPVLSKIVTHLQANHGLHLVVGLGAPFEAELDRQFLEMHRENCDAPAIDLGGKISLLELGGLLKTSTLFVSGDTGPYHMGVGLRTPTLAIFNIDYPSANHDHSWVKCVIAPKLEDADRLIQAADELLKTSPVPVAS